MDVKADPVKEKTDRCCDGPCDLDVAKIRADFPILSRQVNGKKLVYFDSAATTQKPESVIRAITEYYSLHNANVHRGIHTLADEATTAYENTRRKIAGFINCDCDEVVYTQEQTLSGKRYALRPHC